MPDPFLLSTFLGGLLFLIILWFSYNSERNPKSVTNDSVVINSKPKNRKLWSGIDYDDKGELDISNDGLTFRGQKSNFDITRNSIQEIRSIHMQLPWKFIIGLNLLAILFLIYLYSYHYNPWLIIEVLMGLVVLDGMVLVMGTGVEWIELSYKKNGKLTNLYLGQGVGKTMMSRLHPENRGVFGGNYDLYKQMTNILLKHSAS